MRLSSKPRINNLRALCTCALFLATAGISQVPKLKLVRASSDQPRWRVDLNSLGYPQNNPDLQRRRGFAIFDTISFVSDSVLAATFVTREDVPELQRRDDPNHLRPYHLRAVFLDAITGKALRTSDWPIEDPNAGIFPRQDGGFLLVTTDRVVSYSAEGTQLKQLPFSDLHATSARLGGITESPSYKSLVIQFLSGDSAFCLSVRTDTLDSSQIPCGIFYVFTASDNDIVAPEQLPGGTDLRDNSPIGAHSQYRVNMPDAHSAANDRVLSPEQANSAHKVCNPCAGVPQFINNDTLAIYSPTVIGIVDRAGKVRFTQTFSFEDKWIDEFGRPVRSSANGQRFAIAANAALAPAPATTGATSGDGHFFGLDATTALTELRAANAEARRRARLTFAVHMTTGDLPAEFPLDIEVYDLPTARWIYTLQINAEHMRQIWGLALSPSGEKLAIDSGGVIQTFALPPPVAVHK